MTVNENKLQQTAFQLDELFKRIFIFKQLNLSKCSSQLFLPQSRLLALKLTKLLLIKLPPTKNPPTKLPHTKLTPKRLLPTKPLLATTRPLLAPKRPVLPVLTIPKTAAIRPKLTRPALALATVIAKMVLAAMMTMMALATAIAKTVLAAMMTMMALATAIAKMALAAMIKKMATANLAPMKEAMNAKTIA